MATDQARAWANSVGERRPYGWKPSKLTSQQRETIRQRLDDGESLQQLALDYGVTTRTIRRVREG